MFIQRIGSSEYQDYRDWLKNYNSFQKATKMTFSICYLFLNHMHVHVLAVHTQLSSWPRWLPQNRVTVISAGWLAGRSLSPPLPWPSQSVVLRPIPRYCHLMLATCSPALLPCTASPDRLLTQPPPNHFGWLGIARGLAEVAKPLIQELNLVIIQFTKFKPFYDPL